MTPHYMLVWKPLGSKCWTPVGNDLFKLHVFCGTNWSTDLLHVRKVCAYLNGLEHKVWLAGLESWDVAVFRVATVTIADTEELAEPTGETIKIP